MDSRPRGFFLAKISSSGLRFPPADSGIQVNCCKNPLCGNFGVPEAPYRTYRPKGTAPTPGTYSWHHTRGVPHIKCGLCGEVFPARSNAGLAEELDRLSNYLDPHEPSCSNPKCELRGIPLPLTAGALVHYGKTRGGTPRFRCNACRKTFSFGGKSTKRQRITHKNRDVFVMLMNKTVPTRAAFMLGIAKPTLYRKLDFAHKQCLALAADRERRLLEGMELGRRYVAVDRQMYFVNWTRRSDRRNVALLSIASADLASGYVFGAHLNFDGSLNPNEVDHDANMLGDYRRYEFEREFARLWLPGDGDFGAIAGKLAITESTAIGVAKRRGRADLEARIEAGYVAALERPDIEVPYASDEDTKLPAKGMQVREQYTLQAHFLLLARLLRSATKVRVYMDQDSGFRAGFMAAFHDRIAKREADGFYVKVLKEAKVWEKERSVNSAHARFERMKDANPGLSTHEVSLLMVREEMARVTKIGKWSDRWIRHPLPTMSEPEKAVCWLTDLGDYTADHAARLYLHAALHAVDRFFMQTRRMITMAERPIASANSDGRTWYGYAAYNPANLAKQIEMYRVWYNYCLKGRDHKTPAMRLGLARGPIAPEDVLYFTPKSGEAAYA